MPSDQSIKIAIIGGGLAGATLANALFRYSHLDVNIFESAAEFSERGAAVGLAINAQAAIAEIGGPLVDVIERAGGVTMTSSRSFMASGPDAMSLVFDLAGEQRGIVVHRAALLTELLKTIPPEKKHVNKTVDHISEAEDDNAHKIRVHFNDGTEFRADAVIGADGVHGHMRGYVLGKDHPAVSATSAGFWDSRSLVPIEKAKQILGEEYFTESRQYGWLGDGAFFMHDEHDDGKSVQFVLSGVQGELWDEPEWHKKLDRTDLEKVAKDWASPLKNAVVEVMLLNPDLKAYTQRHHAIDAPNYANGRVVIMGDAAHCMTPWQGSGAGQAIEDAMVLETLLAHVTTSAQLDVAFKVYDQVRRERTQKIVHSSAGTGFIMCGRSDAGLDLDKIRAKLPERWEIIYGLNLASYKKEALAIFTENVKSDVNGAP